MYRTIRNISLLITFLIQLEIAAAQSKFLSADSDTTFWYSYNLNRVHQLKMPDLWQSDTTYQWRLWFNGQTTSYVIDSRHNEGLLTLYTQEYKNPITEELSQRIFSKSYTLGTKQLKSIDSLKEAMDIRNIPTDKQIKGWGDVMDLDGVTYVIEEADQSIYSFKSYWTPSAIHVDEAKRLKRFIEAVEKLINFKKLHEEFTQLIPFGSYNTGGSVIALKVMTAKEARKLRRERKAFHKRKINLKRRLTEISKTN